jgi:nicotinamide-nucleotide amidase
MKAGILTIGNEVLAGRVLDTNAAFLGRELERAGCQVVWRASAGDRAADIAEAVRQGMSRADLLVATGGLGPTSDDITKRIVSRLFGSRLVLDRQVLKAIQDRFAQRKVAMPACNRVQAMVPDRAAILANPQGTAPGLLFKRGRKLVALLPGVHREAVAIWQSALLPLVAAQIRTHNATAVVRTFGAPESSIAERLRDVERGLPRGTLAYLPSSLGVDLAVTIRGRAQQTAQDRADAIAGAVRKALGDLVYGSGDETMSQAVGRLLKENRLWLSMAESCTGGLAGDRITDTPGSSQFFRGGVVAYSNELKIKLLAVRPETLRRHGAVSAEAAREMAVGARCRLDCGISLAITGIAGPSGDTPSKPAGLVYLAVSGPFGDLAQERRFLGPRRTIKELAAQAGLNLLRLYLAKKGKVENR